MAKDHKEAEKLDKIDGDGEDIAEAAELVLYQVPECYVYMIPPRISAASYRYYGRYKAKILADDGVDVPRVTNIIKGPATENIRADEWDINKWAWEGTLKVVSKGEECIIRLEDKTTGELYARAFLRDGEPHPVEPVIDSSRYFVLRVEENIGGRLRHAFLGIGFRERPQAYDFQAALHDHMKYLNKKKTAEEMEQQYQNSSSVDYSLKDGETIVLQLKNKGGSSVRSKFFELGLNKISLEEKGNGKEHVICLKPPPPPPSPLSPSVTTTKAPALTPSNFSLEEHSKDMSLETPSKESSTQENQSSQDIPDDDFGDFQAA